MLAIFLADHQGFVKTLYAIHLIAAVAAFGPLFLYPPLQRAGETATIAKMHMRLAFPALIVLWVAGMGIAGVDKFDLAAMWWLLIALVLWIVALAVSWFMIRPAITDTSDAGRSQLAAGIGITHLIFVVSLLLMIFKPFVDGYYKFS